MRQRRFLRSISQVLAEPALGFRNVEAFSTAVILDLVPIDFPDGKVLRLGVREVEAGDGTGGNHREAFGEMNSHVLLRIQKVEYGALFRMIRLSRISGSWSNPLITFFDQLRRGEFFVRRIPPEP